MKPQSFSENYWNDMRPVFYWSKHCRRWTVQGSLSPEVMDFIGYMNWVAK